MLYFTLDPVFCAKGVMVEGRWHSEVRMRMRDKHMDNARFLKPSTCVSKSDGVESEGK